MIAVDSDSALAMARPPAALAPAARPAARRLGFGLALAALALVGLAWRIWLARGPLWLDEIWSIENLAPLTRFWQVFWGISHDNNHFLNSLWLYFASPLTADALILRAPSIALGALTVLMMARLAARNSPAAALTAAAMTAFSYFFVNYSVEARGYAGMALAILVAFDALERSLGEADAKARFVFAAASGIGLLCHLAMLPVIGLFALICLLGERRALGRWEPAVAASLRFLSPTALAIVPALACVVAGMFVVGRLTIGGLRGFDAGQAMSAIADMARDTIGLPFAAPAWAILAAGAALIAVAIGLKFVINERITAYLIVLIVLPLGVFVLRPPNAHIPRYYLVCALFLILLLAETFGALWRAGLWGRLAGLVGLAAILAGDASQLMRFQDSKTTAWPQALAAIGDSGERIVASSFDDRVGKLIAYYNRDHAPLALVARADWCAKRPQWFIAETADASDLPATLDLPAGDCRLNFDFVRRYESWGLSKVGWALYRAR